MKRGILALVGALLLAGPALAQHGDEGDIAYQRGLAYKRGGEPALAAHWLDVAATRGRPEAMFVLANMLLDGDGVPKDEPGARRWLKEAAQLDYPEAWQQLGMMEKDPERAAQYMRRAAHALTHRAEGKR